MLQFQKGTYKLRDLITLYMAIGDAQLSLECTHNCNKCDNRKPCKDLTSLAAYLENLIEDLSNE